MITRNLRAIVVLAAVIALLAASSCAPARPLARVGELQTRSESVELDGAKSESVVINMGAGNLYVSGGASKLMQAKFTYNVAELEPQVKYSGGELSVRNPDVRTDVTSYLNIADYRYEWDLQLNDKVPMDLRVNVGAGSADLKLGSLSLTRLDIQTGAAPATVDLTGNWQDNLRATITGGIGGLTLRLPRSACVRVGIDGGIGMVDAQGLTKDGDEYVNTACGEPGVTLRIDISAGAQQITMEVVG